MAKHPTMALEDLDRRDRDDRHPEVALRLEPVRPEPTPLVARIAREPSRRLMLAVLADAIATFRRTAAMASRDEARTFAETAHWFASPDEGEPFAFLRICRTLGLDAAYLREGLKSIRARARAKRLERVLH